MAKAGRSWKEQQWFGGRQHSVTVRYYYPNSPSKKGRYKQIKTAKGWSRYG